MRGTKGKEREEQHRREKHSSSVCTQLAWLEWTKWETVTLEQEQPFTFTTCTATFDDNTTRRRQDHRLCYNCSTLSSPHLLTTTSNLPGIRFTIPTISSALLTSLPCTFNTSSPSINPHLSALLPS
jgi:hypothetical protein